MQPNPILRKLGLSVHDRAVILHTDDIGMCQASIQAFSDLYDFGLISSGSVMVPCPWFRKAAEFARQHPDADLGVHLTLTSEWDAYRWGPISTRDPLSGLIDDEGFFYRQTEPAVEHGDPSAIQAETEAQVTRAVDAGIQLTHVDTHMGVSVSPKFIDGYLKVALEHRLPAMVFRFNEEILHFMGYDDITAAAFAMKMRHLEELGMPLLDQIGFMPLDQPQDQIAFAKAALDALQPGITHFILHPSVDTPELRAIAPDWQSRVANYETFMSEEIRRHLRQIGIQVIGYRLIQQLMPDPEPVLEALSSVSGPG